MCFHDGLANCRTLDEFASKLAPYPMAGDSDSGLLMFREALMERYPDARWALILREPKEVADSLVRMTPYRGQSPMEWSEAIALCEEWWAEVETMIRDPRVHVLWSHDLEDESHARALFQHCLRDVPWSSDRYRMLRDLRVTVASEKVSVSREAAAALIGEA